MRIANAMSQRPINQKTIAPMILKPIEIAYVVMTCIVPLIFTSFSGKERVD
jgi:hypothetical protein